MGAYDESHQFTAKDKAKAVEHAESYQRACQHEHGHGAYTGHLGTAGVGVQHAPKTFATTEEARRWILDNHNKWDLPYLAKIDGGDQWLLAGWCSS